MTFMVDSEDLNLQSSGLETLWAHIVNSLLKIPQILYQYELTNFFSLKNDLVTLLAH